MPPDRGRKGAAPVSRITPGIIAIIIGAIAAIILFVPFVAASYRVRGGLTWRRTIGWLALLVSFIAIWTYTILPAPAITDDYRCSTPNLNLFQDLQDILRIQASGVDLIANAAFQVTVLNIVFFVPLGFLIRSLFNRGVVVSLIAGFTVSLAVETTQLTGLWGIYPCSYRLFSVGDLLHNTVGAVIGSLLALLILRRRRDAAPQQRTTPALTTWRRLLGILCDAMLAVTVAVVAGIIVSLFGSERATNGLETVIGTVAAVLVYFVPLLITGSTLGEAAVDLEARDGRFATVVTRTVRGALGLGGAILISELVPVIGDVIAILLVIVNLAFLFRTKGRALFASWAAGTSIHSRSERRSASQESVG